jgi:hypothetical protein
MVRLLAALLLLGLSSSPVLPQQGKHAVSVAPDGTVSGHAVSDTEETIGEDAATATDEACVEGAGWENALRYYGCVARNYTFSTTERAIATFAGILTLSTLLLWLFTMRAANAARAAARHIPAVDRAYIFIQPNEKGGFIGPGSQTVAFVEVQNFGPTPGFLETLYGEFSRTEPKGRKPRYDPSRGVTFTVDTAIGNFESPTPLHQRFEAPGIDPIYFFGYVEYRDIFKRRHTSRFCALLDPITGSSNLAGDRAWNGWD